MAQLRPAEHEAIQNLWVVNKCSSPGHCRPQDQNLEAMFNNSAKNCFKLGTVQNVLNKSSLIQERERCHKNLKDDLSLSNSTAKPKKHEFRISSIARLRASWRKGLAQIFKKLKQHSQEEPTEPSIVSLHSDSVILNPDLVNARETGRERLEKFVAVKVTQKNGWCLENPKVSEMCSAPKAQTSRQKNAALNQAKVQVEAMSSLLLQSTGMQATLSENCIPPQLLKKDGKSLHFSKKSDITSWLFRNFNAAFFDQEKLDAYCSADKCVSCVIRDCMFDFRNLDIPTCTYKEMALLMIKKTVLPIASVYANKNRHFTLIQTFDRRADRTKGCTEATRASTPICNTVVCKLMTMSL